MSPAHNLKENERDIASVLCTEYYSEIKRGSIVSLSCGADFR